MGGDLLAALSLLTRLPVRRHAAPRPRGIWAYPVVGLLVGGVSGLAFALARSAGVPPVAASLWAVAASMLLTGALHEDGLADTADGLGGGRDRAQKLAIMRDSRIGSFGALALVISVMLRSSALAEIDVATPGSAGAAAALTVAATLGRAAMIVPLATLPAAREDGMAAAISAPPAIALVGGFAVACCASLIFAELRAAVSALCAVALTALAMTAVARRSIGGHTGDVLGATEQASECVVLSVLAALAAG
jgi:adenosylcobinamide-GDP ribazoletransferase